MKLGLVFKHTTLTMIRPPPLPWDGSVIRLPPRAPFLPLFRPQTPALSRSLCRRPPPPLSWPARNSDSKFRVEISSRPPNLRMFWPGNLSMFRGEIPKSVSLALGRSTFMRDQLPQAGSCKVQGARWKTEAANFQLDLIISNAKFLFRNLRRPESPTNGPRGKRNG